MNTSRSIAEGREGCNRAPQSARAHLRKGWAAAAGLVAAQLCAWSPAGAAAAPSPDYAVVVSAQAHADAGWRRVADALQTRHNARVIVVQTNLEEALADLRKQFPRYVCFVARPAEATREMVARAHRLTRKLDEDPYADCFWGILTGYDAANALRIAQTAAPLTVRKVAAGTEVALEKCEEGVWHCELTQGKTVRKEKGGTATVLQGPGDSTEALVKTLTEYRADCFITSGHATERDWQIGFRYRNGSFRCADGALYGLDTQGRKHPIQSPNPKVYLPVGNCLMGHIDGPDAMALAFMNSAGVCQMLGYTLPTWYGYAGWGCLDYFIEQPGRFTFTEAFFANQAALIHRLQSYFPSALDQTADASGRTASPIQMTDQARAAGLTANDARGLLFDRDTLAFYGDPAWQARLAPGPTSWGQTLTRNGNTWTFEVKPNLGEKTFEPANRNGSQRGGRPLIQFFPERIAGHKVLEGADLKPVITDNFILAPMPRTAAAGQTWRVVFEARLLEDRN